MDMQPSNLEEPLAQGTDNTLNEAAATAAGAGIENQAEPLEADGPDGAPEDPEAAAEDLMTEGEKEEESSRRTHQLTEEELLAAVVAMLEKDPSEYSGEDINRLRQRFTMLHSNLAVAAEDAAAAEDARPDSEPAAAKEETADEIEVQPDARPSLSAQFEAAIAELRARKTRWTAEMEAKRADNLRRKNEIIDQIAALADDTDNVNRTFPRYRELQDEFNAIGEVDPTQETAVWKRFQEVREQYSDNLKINKELRDYDFKKNLAEKESLLAEARALALDDDVIAAYRRLQDLHNKWRQIGPVAKEQRDQIWANFREASAAVNRRYQEYFEALKAQEAQNEAAKTLLCERVEAIDTTPLKNIAAWERQAEKIKEMQAEWRTLGFASKKANRQLFARFRKACDAFFTSKNEFARNVRQTYAANLALRRQIVEEAEALATSTAWRATADRLIALQAQWKEIGQTPHTQMRELWTRFKAATDAFFEAKKRSGENNEQNVNLKTKREIVGELSALITDGVDKSDAIARLSDLQKRWRETGHVPFREKEKIYTAYTEAVDAVRAHFGLANRGERRTRREGAATAAADGADKTYTERDRLMRTIESRRAELRTYENNLGFLSSRSKAGDSLVRDMERRIERIKEDIAKLLEKAKSLDSQIQ